MLKLYETFLALQGEGVYVGTPSVFVRTHGCNLACTWCDTPHTSLDAAKTAHITVSPEELAHQVKTSYPHARHIVLTGGEPSLQYRQLNYFLDFFQDNGEYLVTLETNAEFCRDEPLFKQFLSRLSLLSMSPKLFVKSWDKTETLLQMASESVPLIQAKIVVENVAQVEEAIERVDRLRETYLMLEFILQPQYFVGGSWPTELAEYVANHPRAADMRVIPQIHKDLKIR